MRDSYMDLLEKKSSESRFYDSFDMMEHIFEDNPQHLLVFIQFQIIRRETVYDANIHFCNTFGDGAMSYNDFDFWYYRFRNGEYDLDYDRSKDPKLRELSDLPIELVEMIIENIEEEERYDLANVSKAFRGIMDKQSVRKLKIEINMKEFEIFYNQRKLCFKCENETVYKEMKEDGSGDTMKVAPKKTYMEMGFEELARIFNHSERRFEQISLNFKDEPHSLDDLYDFIAGPEVAAIRKEERAAKLKEIHINLETFFKSLPHQIHAEKCHVTNATCEEHALSILPYLRPKLLQNILISGRACKQFDIDRIIASDQFKQAYSFDLSGVKFKHSVDTLFRFNKIHASMNTFLTVEEVTRLKDFFLASPDFESCSLSYDFETRSTEVEEAYDGKVFPFPDSNGFLKLRAHHSFVSMERVYSI